MKKLILSLLAFGFAWTDSVAQTTATSATDEAAIKNMLEAVGKAFDEADYKAYRSHW